MKSKLFFPALCALMMCLVACEPNNGINHSGENGDSTSSNAGVFSVAGGKRVTFAPGNLQYQASTKTWRFAEHQYDYIGEANSNISSSYSGWIDLFCWGTGDNPTKCESDINISTPFIDWGINEIALYAPRTWYTLSADEWQYLFFERPYASELFGLGTINGVNGVIILPDSWMTPAGLTFSPSTTMGLNVGDGYHKDVYYNSAANNFTHNTYTASQWQKLEKAGAIFLPASGYRHGTEVVVMEDSINYGIYWSKTINEQGVDAYSLGFSDEYLYPKDWDWGMGRAVRLVRDVKN